MSKKAKALVTGAAGFIGAHVAGECVRQGFEVVGLDDLSGGFEQNVPKGVSFVKGSVTDDKLVEELFAREKFDHVFHLGAYAAEGLSHFIRRFNYETNLGGSVALINAAVRHNVKCFFFTSSIAVYGRNQLPMVEELAPQPEDPYGVSKYAVELDLRAAHEMFGLNFVMFRPHNVYGEMQNIADKYRNVIGIFMNQLLQGKPMSIFGDGGQTRAFSYVGDMVGTMVRSVTMPECYGQVFNIGADKPYTVLELAQEVARALQLPANIIHLPARNEVVHAYASHAKVGKFFGPQPETSLGEGLKRMAVWVKRVGVREPVRFKNIEITRNLPPKLGMTAPDPIQEKVPVSILMLTFNEEVNIEHALRGLAGWTDDVVILDSFSTDRTVEIARSYGARVFQNKFPGHARQWLWGFNNIEFKYEWLFMHDPDHRVMPELKQELGEVFAKGIPSDVNGLYVKRRNVFQRKWIRHGGYYPKYMLKIVRRKLVYFDEHEFDYRAYVPGRTLQLQHDIIEENFKEEDITFWIEKHNGFATRQAEEEMFRGRHPESWKTTPAFWGNADQRTLWLKIRWYGLPLYLRPFLYFTYRYFFLLGFLDGGKGFIFHFLQAFWYRLVVDVKLDQLRQKEAGGPNSNRAGL